MKPASFLTNKNRQSHLRLSAVPLNNTLVALAGNPNTGKSTVFNALTGLKQHTGNWPGKTVLHAWGPVKYNDIKFLLVDLPGTYSLTASSEEEIVARDFICFANPDVTVVVTDATCLERNLNLTLQVLEITPNVILCVNLIDEAKRKGINIDTEILAEKLGIPVIATVARNGKGLKELQEAIYTMILRGNPTQPIKTVYPEPIERVLNKWAEPLKKLLPSNINPRWVVLKILEGDLDLQEKIKNLLR